MKIEGMVAAGSGAALCFYAAFIQKVSVESDYGQRDIINIGLQQDRLLAFALGLTLIIVGTILYSASKISTAMRPSSVKADESSFIIDNISKQSSATDLEHDIQRFGIKREGEKGPYVYGEYRYDRVEDAIAYARSRED